MPIFIKGNKSALYVHVPKTGGRYIEQIFLLNGFEVYNFDEGPAKLWELKRCTSQHFHAELLRQTLRVDQFDFVFMTVRHPISRFKSEYCYSQREHTNDIDRWGRQILGTFREDSFVHDNHIRPQHEFFLPEAAIFKQENGYDDRWISEIETKLDLQMSIRSAPRFNDSLDLVGRRSSELVIAQDLVTLLEEFYAEDFQMFGYEPGLR
jgi:hypothetical protein